MQETIDAESATCEQGVKRKDVLRRTVTVLFSSFAAAGALEAVPLPASAQHVIGMALIAKGSLPKDAVMLATLKKRRPQQQPTNATQPTMQGFAYLAVTAGSPNPFTDPQYTSILAAELKFLAAMTLKTSYLLASQAAPMKFGYDGELSRFGGDNSGDGKHGQDFYSNDKEANVTPQYYDVWLGIY